MSATWARAAGKEEEEEKAAAASPQGQEARKKYAEGKERYARGDYDGAAESYKAAIAADPALPGPYRELGLTYRALNRCADAIPMYEKYLELRPESRFTDRVRREIDLCRAKQGLAPLPDRPHSGGTYHPAEQQSYLHVAANLIGGEATDEASVRVDGLVRGSTPLTIPVPSGKHRVHLERLGFESADATVDVQPGQRQEVELTMNKLPEQPKQISGENGTDDNPSKPKGSYRKYAWALLGVAAGLGAMGAGFGIAESQLHAEAVTADHATTPRATIDKKRTDGTNFATGAYIGLSVGGAALAASVIIFIVDPSRRVTSKKESWSLAPTVSSGGAGLAAAGSF
jgi:tetratricopeptide (TPR) repeat protein